MILALDLSTTCTGYAIGPLDGPVELYGSIKPEPRWETLKRIVYTTDEVMRLFYHHGCEFIVAEELMSFRNGKVTRILLHLQGALIYRLVSENNAPCTWLHQPSIKKALGLPGNCRKEEVGRKIKSMGYDPQNLDESDALAVYEGAKLLLSIEEAQWPYKGFGRIS